MSAAALIRTARTDAGLTQGELARRMGVQQPVVARLEREGSDPRFSTIVRALKAMGRQLHPAVGLAPGVDDSLIVQNLRLSPADRLRSYEAAHSNSRDFVTRARKDTMAFSPLAPGKLLRALVARGVDVVVIGGVARVLYGSASFTFDLDLTATRDEANLEQLGAALMDVGSSPAPAALAHRDAQIETPAGVLHIVDAPHEQLRARAERMNLGDFAVLVASIEDLIAMKRTAGRKKDLADIEDLEAIRRLRGRPRA